MACWLHAPVLAFCTGSVHTDFQWALPLGHGSGSSLHFCIVVSHEALPSRQAQADITGGLAADCCVLKSLCALRENAGNTASRPNPQHRL